MDDKLEENGLLSVLHDKFPFKSGAVWLGLLAYIILVCILVLIFTLG